MLNDIRNFFWAVINNWAGYITGGLIIAAVTVWFGLKGKTMPRKTLIVLLVLFGLMACFKAWEEQNLARRGLENNVRLSGSIKRVVFGVPTNDPDATMFTFVVEVVNGSERPTIADKWRATVRLPNESIGHVAQDNFIPQGRLHFTGPSGEYNFSPEDDLRTKAGFTPVASGARVIGYVSFVIRNIRMTSFVPHTTWDVSFCDFRGSNYVCGGFVEYKPEDVITGSSPIPGMK
jgi:hypothetical protein